MFTRLLPTVFLIFLLTSNASAFEDDGTWSENTFYNCADWTNGHGNSYGPTHASACDKAFDLLQSIYNVTYTSGSYYLAGYNAYRRNAKDASNQDTFVTVRPYQNTCNGTSDPSGSQCGVSPGVADPDCPSEGEIVRLSRVLNGHIDEEGYFVEDGVPPGGLTIDIGNTSYDKNGCKYNNAASPDPVDSDAKCYFVEGSGGTQMRCSANHYALGTWASDPAEIPSDNPYTAEELSLDPPVTEAETDNRTSTESIVYPESTTETLPDGTVVDTQTTVTTEVRGDGTLVEESAEQWTITDTNGIQKTTTVTTTTITNPDGSKTVTTDTNYSYTNTGDTYYTINKEGDRISISASPGSSASGSTTNTKTYDSEGNLTSDTTTKGAAEGDPEGKEEAEEEGACEEDPNSKECVGEFEETAKGSFEEGKALAAYGEASLELEQLLDVIKTESSELFGGTLSGGGALTETPLYWHGQQYSSGGIFQFISWLDFMNLSSLILLAAAFFALYILLGDNRN